MLHFWKISSTLLEANDQTRCTEWAEVTSYLSASLRRTHTLALIQVQSLLADSLTSTNAYNGGADQVLCGGRCSGGGASKHVYRW